MPSHLSNLSVAAIISVIAMCGPAPAQAPAPATAGLDLQVGGTVGIAPRYEGSKDYRAVGFPIIAPSDCRFRRIADSIPVIADSF